MSTTEKLTQYFQWYSQKVPRDPFDPQNDLIKTLIQQFNSVVGFRSGVEKISTAGSLWGNPDLVPQDQFKGTADTFARSIFFIIKGG